MNLGEFRQWFVQQTGRYDLVVDTVTWADNGANKLIEAGQRGLDRMLHNRRQQARSFHIQTAGTLFVAFQECRTVKEVFVTELGVGKFRLTKGTYAQLRGTHPNMELEADRGRPEFYIPTALRATSQNIGDLAAYINYADVLAEADSYDGILLYPPCDKEYMIEVFGLFYSTPLRLDSDTSFWSINHPEILLMGTALVMEKLRRNSEGMKDWKNAIDMELIAMDQDAADEDTEEDMVLEG